jgi:hypothetical protein
VRRASYLRVGEGVGEGVGDGVGAGVGLNTFEAGSAPLPEAARSRLQGLARRALQCVAMRRTEFPHLDEGEDEGEGLDSGGIGAGVDISVGEGVGAEVGNGVGEGVGAGVGLNTFEAGPDAP